MVVGFSIKPYQGSGVGAQLQQFAFLYALGRSFGWEYVHVPWEANRFGSSIYDEIGVNKALSLGAHADVDGRAFKRIDVVDSTFLDPAGRLVSPVSLVRDFGQFDRAVIVDLTFTTWQRCNLLRKIVAPQLSGSLKTLTADYPDFRNITGETISALHVDTQMANDLVVVAHLRRGDTAVIKVGGRLVSCWQFTTDANGKHHISVNDIAHESDAFYPPVIAATYLEVLRACIDAIRNANLNVNLKVVIVSDGYEKAKAKLLGSATRLKLSPEAIDEAIDFANSEFRDFKVLPAHELLIGEDESCLKKAIYWIARADLLISGTGSFGDTVKNFFSLTDDYSKVKLTNKGNQQSDLVVNELIRLIARKGL
jgi:hypothetical protein